MQKFKVKQWFKSLFDFESLSRSKHPRAGRLSVEPLEVRLTPDAKILPAFQNLGMGMAENKSASDAIALIDDISYQQNLPDCRASQIFLCSNDSPDHAPLQPVNKFDAIAMQAASTKGVVLIDSSLVATIPADELKGSLVVSIYGNRNVISQFTTALEGLSNVPVLRIISHGSDGVLWFGNQAFDSADLTSSAMQVASWGKSLATDADILLYGCSVANTDAGKAFVNRLASLTDADVAASSNTTGMGGDEVLEFQVGQVSNSLVAAAIDYDSANLTLAQITVTTTADTGSGSLRQAIADANNSASNDEIIFASSLFTNGANTITLGSAALPTIAATSSAGSLTISGPGASSLIISGDNGNTSRNFSVFNIASGGNLSISGVTVSGAKTTSNGGGFSNLGTLSVSNSLISGNIAAGGGGIYSRGILTVNNSTFSGNSTTSQNGGAVWNYGGSANSNIFNSTISSNTATTSSGGGISNTGGAVTLSNSTLFGNQAAAGGGIFNNANGIFTIFNTTISNNSATNNGGGIHVGSGTLNISNTIIANSLSGGDFYSAGSMGTNSNNLVEDGSLPGNSELTGDPLLGPLQNNGGSTFTMALGVGSIAIGAGNANTTNASPVNGLDQRGAARSLTAPSIGAFESINKFLYNIPQTSTFGYGFYNAFRFADNSEKVAQRFLTQPDASVITDIKLNIWTELSNWGTYTVKIYSDNSGSVGTTVATVGTRDILSIFYPGGTLTPAVFSGLNLRLTPSTAYWMVVENDAGVVGGGMYWGCGGNGSNSYVANPTTAARFNYYTTPQWGNLTIPALGMQVSAIPAPLANAQSITPTEDTTYTGSLTGSSANGNKLNYLIVAGPTKGTVTITNPATGAFNYVPNSNATGLDSFTFKVNDGILDSAVATISVNITPVNDAPVANAQTITLNEDSTFSGSLGASDVDGNGLTYFLVSQGAKGTVTLNSSTGAFSYVPNVNANGSDSFTFKVNDGTVDSATATVTVYITPVNDSPVTSSSSVTLASIVEDSVNPSGATVQSLFGSLFSDSADNQRQLPVTETFSSSTGGWTNGMLDSSQDWGSFLGRYGMNSEISKTFATGGNSTTISFEFMRIDSWDGEFFRLYANDVLIINQNFYCNQQITSTLSGSVSGYTWTMTPVDYGYKSNAGWDDQKFLVTLNVPSGVASLTLRLNSTLNQGADDESWGIDNFNSGIPIGDGSIANTFAGVAISNYTVDASKGQWQYSSDASNWSNLPTTTASSAVTLRPADYLRFVPAANYNGQATALSANLIETGGNTITSGGTVNLSVSTVYSQSTVAVNQTITPVNDAPVASSSITTLAAINEDSVNPSGATVQNLFGSLFSDSADNGVASLAGVAISSYTVDTSKGNWQYSTDSSTWSNLSSATSSAAITLRATDYLRFVPAANYNGQATALSANLIETGGAAITSGAVVNLSGVGSQLVLGSGNVIGWGSIYSSSFAADNIVDEQSGPIVTDNFGDNYWLASDGTGTSSILIDLGVATPLSKIELYNTTNAWHNDRGTSNFHIEVANAISGNSATTYSMVNGLTVASGTMAAATVGVAPTAQTFSLSSGSMAYRYVRFVVDSSRNNNPGLHELRLFGTATGVGGTTVYSQQTVSVNHTITSVNDAPVIGGIDAVVNYISTDFTTAPANAIVSGSATISNGECVLTPAIGGQNGYLLFNTLPSNPTAFSAQFDYRVADGSGADGTSFNYGPINGLGNLYEYGITNSGLVVSFIEYGSQRVEVKFNGALLQSSNFTLLNPNYQRIIVNVDGSNKLSLSIGGVPVVSNLDLGSAYGNANKASWQFGFASRTGGATNKHSVDNLNISSVIAPVEALEQSPTILNGGLTLTDLDNPTLASATVSISNGFRNNEDVLGFVSNTQNYGNIAGTFSTSTGVLALTSAGATATLAQWQAALRSVTYTNTSDTPNTSNRVVSFVVNDEISDSNVSTVTVKVTPVNDAPVANAQTITTNEDTTYTGTLSGLDVEGSALTYSVVTQGARGSVTWNSSTGAFTYVPYANANGSDSFTFKVNDGSLDSTTGTVTVSITPVNDAPVVSASQPSVTLLDYQYTRNWGVDQSFITITKMDVDGSVQYDEQYFAANGWTSSDNGVTVTRNTTYGYVVLRPSTNVLTYYLDQGLNLTNRLRQSQTVTETIPIQVTDGQLTAITNAVFTIEGQNDEPELYRVNNLVGASEDSEYEITYAALTDNSQLADIDGGVTAFVVKSVTNGVLKIGATAQNATPWNAATNATITTGLNGYWTPALNANGTLGAFTVVVKDNGGLESLNPIQVNVQVAAVNDRPVVTGGATLAYTENDSPIVIDAGLLVSDVDDSHISGATVTIGQVVPGDLLGFTNQNGITGTYVSQTGTLTLSGAATVAQYQQALRSVTFSSTNEDPTLNNTRVNRTISWVVTDSNSGNASNGVLTSDGGSGVSTSYLAGSTYTLNSNGTNPYVIPMDLGQNWSFEAEYRMNSSNGLNTLFSYGNYTDGVLIRTLRGDSLYVKGYDFNQIDVFGTSNTNGSFVPVKITYTTTGTTGTLSIYAAGSLVKSVTSLSPLNPVDKTIRIGSAYHSNGEGLDGAVRNINVTVGIGSGASSQVNITAVNDAPTLQTPEVITVRDTAVLDRFGVISSGLVGSDVDANTTLTYGISGGTVQGGTTTKVGTYGTLVLTTSTGAYTFTPNNAAINSLTSNTTERFTIGVSDGIVTTDADLEVRLVAANDTPTLQTPEVITVRDTAALDNFGVISSGLVGSDVDANTTLTYGITGGTVQGGIATKVGTYGTLVLTTSTGAYTFTPNNAAINALTSNTIERFTIGVSDGIVTTDADLEVRLVAANDTPIVVNIAPVIYTNTNAVDVFANATGFISASDADSSAVLAYGISGQGVVVTNGIASLTGLYGTLSVEVATGQYTYSPNQNQLDIVSGDAVDNFTVTVSDGIASVNKTFVVNINDRETPSVTISSNVSRLKAGEFANITFTFSEVPVGFDLNSLNVAGGVLSNLTGSGSSYLARFTPTINSIIPGSISFKANSYKDSANNFGSGSVLSPLIGIDTLRPLAPVVALSSDTGISAIDKVTYSGIVTVSGIEKDATWEFSNDKGLTWSPGPGDSTFAFRNDGAKSLFVRQTDAAGNLGPVNEFNFVLDTVAPAVPSISLNADTGVSASDKITRDGKINVAGLESTAGFEYSLNSGKDWTLGSGNSFTLAGDGAKLVRVRQIDQAGNIGTATTDLQFTLDTTPISMALSSNAVKLKAGETAAIKFSFSESPFNFDYSDISFEGGSLSNLVQNTLNKNIYTAIFTPSANSTMGGVLMVGVKYNDAAGNAAVDPVSLKQMDIDTELPGLEISSSASALKIGETSLITFTLSEATSDFTLADITVTGGTLSNFQGSNLTYTAMFTPTASTTTTAVINVASGRFTDSFGNQNLASNPLKVSVDTLAPVANFSRIATPRNTGVNSLDLNFTESIEGLDVSDLSLTFNGNLVSLSGAIISGSGANYTISGLNTSAQGAYVFTLNFNASGISDAAGNALGANASVAWSVDTSSPSVAITSSTNRLNPGQTATITFAFTTAPTGFDAADITTVGGSISGLTKSSNTVYTAILTPASNFSGKGSVAVGNGYKNSAGTTGLPGLSEAIAIDTVAPTAIISSSLDRLGVNQTSTITFTFSESVVGFDSTDLRAEGGALGTLTQSDSNPLVYTALFTPTANFTGKGNLTLLNNYADNSGNIGSGSSLSPEMSIDTAPAVVDIIGRGKPLATDTNASAVSFNVRFNETVTGVDASDFELVLSSGVTVTNPLFVSGSGNSYTVDVSGISKTDGMLGIRLKSDSSILDAFNNALVNRTPGENQSYTIDNTAPSVVSIVSDKTRLGATNSATITITFSEVPKGFDSFDVGATFGSISNLSATSNPRVYTATFTPSGVITSDARVTVYQGYSDAAGNPGTALTMVSPIAVVAAPVGKIVPQNPPAEVTPLGNITLLVTFTEDVNNLALDDFTTTGTVTLSGLQRVSNSNRLFTVVATAGSLEGEFSVGLKANATEDSGLSDNKTAAVAPITIRVDASSSFADAKLVSVAQGTKTSASGIADNIKDADFFKFTADFTGSVSTLVKADGSKFDAFATAYVQNDDGSFKLLIADDNSGGGTTSKMDFNVTTGKTYFIKVESLAKTSGRYTVEITGGEKLADDYGDAQSDAASLVVNSTPRVINGTLENNQDKDSFKFTASQTGKASVSMAASTLSTGKLEIYSNSTTVLRTVALNGSAEFDVVAGQTYYLIVSSDAGDVGDYSFSISAKASLLFTTTNAVAVAKATNFLPVAGNVDVYTVVAPSTGLLSILVENKDRGIPSQPEFSVYNASGTRVATNVGAVFGPAGTSKQIINLNTTLGETYLLKIGETGTFTGSYNITAQSDDFGTVRTSPTSLTSGAAAGKIDLSGDADLFSFSYANTTANTAKLQITQTASTGSSLLPSMFVSTDNGSSWIPAINKGTLVELEVDPSTTASLLIWASGASGSTGAYNINTRAVIDDFGNTSATATTVLLDQSNISSTNGIFNYSGDQDVFKVTLNISGTTLFSVESIDDSLFDPKLTITSLSGQVIASDDDSGKGLGSLIVLEGTLGDTFYLTVSGILNSTNGVAYTLKTGELPVDDAGNKPDTSAVPLSFNAPVVVNGKSTQVAIENKTIRAAMPGIADFDVYQFTANDTGRFEISVAPSAGSASLAANLSVLASDGKTVLASTSGSAGKTVFALPYLNKGDKVYISVSGGNSTEGDYTLKVETPVSVVDFFANSHNDTATGLPLGLISITGTTNSGSLASANMNIEAARDVDVFTFTAKNTGPVKVLVSKTTSSSIDTSISIMDASGKVLASNNDADRETTNSAAVFEVSANSVYYISVTGNAGTTGQYGIALQDLTPTDSDGFGSDFSTATILTFDSNLGVRTDDSIISAGDRDLFELTVGSDGVLGFGLNSRESNLDGYLRIYNSDRELIAEDNDSGDGLNSFISVSASAGDVFYIQTGAVGSSVGNYRVWAKLEIDDHANLIGSGATQMDVADNFAYDFGKVNSTTDVDVFSFTATTTGTIDIFLGADEGSSLDTYLFVFDSTGDILINYNNDISTTDKDSALSIQVVEGKTYYFKVSGARGTIGDYTLDISPVADDVGSSIDDATNLPLLVSNSTPANTIVSSVNGSIETYGDADYYKVSISVTGRYKFKVSKDTTSAAGLDDSVLELYSADGGLLGKNDDATSTSSDSALEINLSADDIVYLKASGYGDKTGAYVAEVVYVGAIVADDYGNTTDKASSFVFDDNSSYSLTGAAIQFDGDRDYFSGVADITGDINISLASGSTLQGTVKAFVNRDGVLVQVASDKATAAGTALSLSFSVAASDEFYIQVSGSNATIGSYDLNVTNTVSTTNTTSPKAVDTSVINSTADELSAQFTKAVADAADGADINAISQNITQKLVDAFIASMGGALDQTYIILWLDPADFNFAGAGTNVGNQAGSTTNQGSSTSLSTNGALNTVIVSGAQASQYSLNMTGVGSGQVLAGATMVTAGGQIINPTVSIGGSSSSGIASAGGVPKSGLNMVLDFSTPGSGGGNNGGGNNGGGNNGGNNGGGSQVGVLPGNGGSSESSGGTSSSSSSSSSSATASGSGGGGSFASLVNAIVRTSSAITGTGATTVLANLASIAFGGGGAAATVDEKQLAKELGGDAPGEGLELNEKENKEAKLPGSSDVLKATASLVTVSIAEAYKSTDLAVFSTLQAEHQVISEVATILDKVLPILVPSEFENSVENLLVKTEQSLLQEGKETLTKVANTLADLVQARVDKNLPPVNKKADAKITTFEFVVAGLVDAAKHVQNVQDGGLNTEVLFVQELPEGFEEMLNYTAAYRNNLEDAYVSQAMIIDDESNNKLTEAVGLLAGALLAPGFLNGTNAALASVTEKPRSKKRKF